MVRRREAGLDGLLTLPTTSMENPILTYPNPLIAGSNPDPSVVRVGDDYYIVTSSAEYLPGLPVYHSRDFITWTPVGIVATRSTQLNVENAPPRGGALAPTLRHHNGLFHIVVTDAIGRGTLHFTAEQAEGPWSDGTVFDGIDGIDPDLAWADDGTASITFAGYGINPSLPTFLKQRGMLQARVDLTTGRALESPRTVWPGKEAHLRFAEAPHLHHIGDWWYLLMAEGGTEQGRRKRSKVENS